jgi:hypothetical protein
MTIFDPPDLIGFVFGFQSLVGSLEETFDRWSKSLSMPTFTCFTGFFVKQP